MKILITALVELLIIAIAAMIDPVWLAENAPWVAALSAAGLLVVGGVDQLLKHRKKTKLIEGGGAIECEISSEPIVTGSLEDGSFLEVTTWIARLHNPTENYFSKVTLWGSGESPCEKMNKKRLRVHNTRELCAFGDLPPGATKNIPIFAKYKLSITEGDQGTTDYGYMIPAYSRRHGLSITDRSYLLRLAFTSKNEKICSVAFQSDYPGDVQIGDENWNPPEDFEKTTMPVLFMFYDISDRASERLEKMFGQPDESKALEGEPHIKDAGDGNHKQRRRLIAECRQAISDFGHNHNKQMAKGYLEEKPCFIAVRKHLSDKFFTHMAKEDTLIIKGESRPSLMVWFAGEIDRLETEWGLD